MILKDITDFVKSVVSGKAKLKMANRAYLPSFLAQLMEYLHGSHEEPKPNEFSTTTLLKGTKEILLLRRHSSEIVDDIQDSAATITGTAVHALLEACALENGLTCESKVFRHFDINGKDYVVSGRFDFYDVENHILYDLKDTKVPTFQQAQRGEDVKWVSQLTSYGMCLEDMGYRIDKVCIIAILTDHSKVKAYTDSSYPQGAIQTITWAWNELDSFKTDVIEKQRVKLTELDKYIDTPDDEIPPCTAKERFEDAHFSVYEKTKSGEWKARATKNFDTEEEANEFAKTINGDTKVEFKEGNPIKCKLYCSCKEFCSFYKGLKGV